MRRLRPLAGLGLLALLSLGALPLDAARRRANRDAARHEAVVALTGLSDLALSSSVRWLRHPSQVEPAAPFSDVPGGLDVDPAGGWIGPPPDVLRQGAAELVVRRGP